MYTKNLFLIFTLIFQIFSSAAWSMTEDLPAIEKRQMYAIKNKDKDKEDCLTSCGSEIGNDTASIQTAVKKDRARLLYDGGCCKGGCTSQLNTYPTDQNTHNEELSKYELFGSSFFYGAIYSLIPEICRDALESRGYSSRTSAIVATIVQGTMIVYNAPSYAPTITGIVVRTGLSQLGFSDQFSTTAGSTVAIATSLSEKLMFNKEMVLDCMIDVTIGVAGSYLGSTLALKAKSWAYERWECNNLTVAHEKTH